MRYKHQIRSTKSQTNHKISNFKKKVWEYYKQHGRHDLPWRQTHDVYKILVSEVMLQQTQVERVIPYYKNFIKKFPTAKRLAAAPLSDVLKAWQGLGYNRRAKLLREAAQHIINTPRFGTRFNLVAELENLPGVGPYTARAVAAFAYNANGIVIETNIRTAIIHHFLAQKKTISDKEIEKILVEVKPPQGKAREWYSALMDYGAHLKRSGISHNARTKTYTKQSKFAGSPREARGAILRALAASARTEKHFANLLGPSRRAQLRAALQALMKEGLIEKVRRYRLAN